MDGFARQGVAARTGGTVGNGEIAEMLHISEGTVKNHLKIVFRKLNIDRRSSLRGRLR